MGTEIDREQEFASTDYKGYTRSKAQWSFLNLIQKEGSIVPMAQPKVSSLHSSEMVTAEEPFTIEQFLEFYPIPARLIPPNATLELNTGEEYPYGKSVIMIDKDTGNIVSYVFFMGSEDTSKMELGKRYKAREYSVYEYQEGNVNHPITHQIIPTLSIIRKSWELDKSFRRRSRHQLFKESFVKPSAPDEILTAGHLYMSSEWKRTEIWNAPVSKTILIPEDLRTFFFTNGHVIYSRNNNELKLSSISLREYLTLEYRFLESPSEDQISEILSDNVTTATF